MSGEKEPTNTFHFPSCVISVRNWEDAHLPLSQSRIAFDLFMLIGQSAHNERPLNHKQLFNSLKYSERGIRYVLDQFIDGGWCEVVGQTEDRRFRVIVATQRLTDKLREYEVVVLGKYRAALSDKA